MSEFCGIEPAGAHALLNALTDAAGPVCYLARKIPAGVNEAGTDLDQDAGGASGAFQRYQSSLDFWTRDLRWRIQYIEAMTGGSEFDHVPHNADMPYQNFQQAQQQGSAAGKAEGERLKQLWEQSQNDPRLLPRLAAELAKLGPYRYEPYYAGALLKALGKETFAKILTARISPEAGVARAQGMGKGLQNLRQEFGPLADLFAAADRGGTLPLAVRKNVLQYDPHVLAIFLRLSDGHTDQFALEAARHILALRAVPGLGIGTDDGVAARQILLGELWRRPGVVQVLLHDPKYTKELYYPDVISSGHLRQYQRDLAAVLRRALDSSAGDLPSRQQAWTNLIKVGADPRIRELMALSPDLATALTERLKPYIPWLSFMQGRNAAELNHTPINNKYMPNTPIIPGLATKNARDYFPDVRDFLAGLVSNPAGRHALEDAARENMQQYPVLSPAMVARLRNLNSHNDQSQFWEDAHSAQAAETGFVGLLLRAGKVSQIDHDKQVDFVSDVIGIGVGKTPGISDPFVGFGVKYGLGDPQHKLAEWMLSDQRPGDPRSILTDAYAERVRKELTAAHIGYIGGDYDNLVNCYTALSLGALENDKAKK
ncbi:hypothetical protein [Streptomyces sioyaensis]|uniref:hypothetical protein n=1 Tax=Streptomyces sioyaensis TaxID=67364 RepID=UPI0037AE55CA